VPSCRKGTLDREVVDRNGAVFAGLRSAIATPSCDQMHHQSQILPKLLTADVGGICDVVLSGS
jgi:hypothetical protein